MNNSKLYLWLLDYGIILILALANSHILNSLV